MSLRADIPDHFIDVEGLRIRYIEKGEGRPLLFLHGMSYTFSADLFLPHIDAFSQFSHVYAIDLPGWGLSEPAKEGPYFQKWVEVVNGFCDAMGFEEMDVYGFSIGGWIASLFAVENTHRVRRLALVDSPGLNLEAPNFVTNFKVPTREALRDDMAINMAPIFTEAMLDEMYARLTRPGQEEAYRALAAEVVNPDIRRANSLHSVFPRLTMPLLLSQQDNTGTVLIRFMFEAYQLAQHPRMFINYGSTPRTVSQIGGVVEDTVIEFLTADEVPAPTRK